MAGQAKTKLRCFLLDAESMPLIDSTGAASLAEMHNELAEKLRDLTGCEIEFAPGAETVTFPQINIERMRSEFHFAPASILDELANLVRLYESNREALK